MKAVFTALQGIVTSEVAENIFKIPQLVKITLRHKAARPEGKKIMFGKQVTVAAKKASNVLKITPDKAIAGKYRHMSLQ